MVGRYVVALLLLFVTALAQAEPPPSHLAWTRAAAARLPIYFEDKAPELAAAKAEQLDAVARVIAEVSRTAPRPPREWAALLLTIGYHESTFSLRIHRGECNLAKRECDAGRARSSFQLHKNLFTAPVWDELHGLEHTEVQVRAADAALRRGYWTCARSGVPWLQGTINGFAGKRCGASWPGLEQRAPNVQPPRRRPSQEQVMSNTTNARVRILYLEADNADAESVGALVGIISEVQGGGRPPVARVGELVAAGGTLPVAFPSAPASPSGQQAPSVRKPRAPKPTSDQAVKRLRLFKRKCGKCGSTEHDARTCTKA